MGDNHLTVFIVYPYHIMDTPTFKTFTVLYNPGLKSAVDGSTNWTEAFMQGNTLSGQNIKDQIKALLFECYIFLRPQKRPDEPVHKDDLVRELTQFKIDADKEWFADGFKGIGSTSRQLIIERIMRLMEYTDDDDIMEQLAPIYEKLAKLTDIDLELLRMTSKREASDDQLFY